MLVLLPTVLSLFAVAAPPTITPAEAAKHVGEEVVVQGTIDQIATTVNLTTHINFGGRYPNHVFTATILKAKQGLFTRVKTLEGTVAQVQGVVKLYRGKPEIMLNEPSQLRAAAAAEPAPAQAAAPGAPASAASPGTAARTALPAVAALRFDPRGADFGAWVSQFKQEVSPTAMPEADLARAGQRARRLRVRGREGRVDLGGPDAQELRRVDPGPGGGERAGEGPLPAAAPRLPGRERHDAGHVRLRRQRQVGDPGGCGEGPPAGGAMVFASMLVVLLAAPAAERPALTGVVKGSDDRPLAGAMVFIYTARPRSGTSTACPSCYLDCRKHAETDADGAFAIASLDPALLFQVGAIAEGHQASFQADVDPAAGPIRVTLSPQRPLPDNPRRVVRARVVDADGSPGARRLRRARRDPSGQAERRMVELVRLDRRQSDDHRSQRPFQPVDSPPRSTPCS